MELLGDTEVEGEEFARLLRLTLSQYAVATIPATLDQVKVSPLNWNDRHTVAHLFLLGANDHVLPTVEKPGGILDQQERELLQQQGILLSDATFDPLSNELQNIYAALAQPPNIPDGVLVRGRRVRGRGCCRPSWWSGSKSCSRRQRCCGRTAHTAGSCPPGAGAGGTAAGGRHVALFPGKRTEQPAGTDGGCPRHGAGTAVTPGGAQPVRQHRGQRPPPGWIG